MFIFYNIKLLYITIKYIFNKEYIYIKMIISSNNKNNNNNNNNYKKEASLYKNVNNFRHILDKCGARDENISWLMKLRSIPSSLNTNNSTTKVNEFNFRFNPKKKDKLKHLISSEKIIIEPYKEDYKHFNANILKNYIKSYKGNPVNKADLHFETTLRSYELKPKKKKNFIVLNPDEDSEIEIENFNSSIPKLKYKANNNNNNNNNNNIRKTTKNEHLLKGSPSIEEKSTVFNSVEKFSNSKSPENFNPIKIENIFNSNSMDENSHAIKANRKLNTINSINDRCWFLPPFTQGERIKQTYNNLDNNNYIIHPVKYKFNIKDWNEKYSKVNSIKQKIAYYDDVSTNILVNNKPDAKNLAVIGNDNNNYDNYNFNNNIKYNRKCNKHYTYIGQREDSNVFPSFKEKNLNNIRHIMKYNSNPFVIDFESGLRLYNKETTQTNILFNFGLHSSNSFNNFSKSKYFKTYIDKDKVDSTPFSSLNSLQKLNKVKSIRDNLKHIRLERIKSINYKRDS